MSGEDILRPKSDLFTAVLPVFGMTFLLGIWGLLTICSSQSEAPRPLFLASRQFGALLLTMLVMFIGSKIPFQWFRRYALWAGLALYLVLVSLPVWGVRVNSMAGWFRVGTWQFQPSELAKGFFLFELVRVLCRKNWSVGKRFGAALLVGVVWIVPILLEPDMGTAIVYFSGVFLAVFLAGAPWKYLLGSAAVMLVALCAFLSTHAYAWRRFTGFFRPELDPLGSNWHLRQFEMTISRGEFFGTKLGNAVWSNCYLPLPYNDSALATMMETLGFFGALPVAVFYLLLIWSLLRLARGQRQGGDRALYLRCTAYLLAVQALIHAAVNAALVPATGLTMPFISFGGSSLLGSGIMLGIALSAGAESKEPFSAEESACFPGEKL